jgi:hypothetical protein
MPTGLKTFGTLSCGPEDIGTLSSGSCVCLTLILVFFSRTESLYSSMFAPFIMHFFASGKLPSRAKSNTSLVAFA